jgi:hypothetical protein|tara:strand:- start:39 stop:497 length:459 start_codon:yes stop_codon:yes gene_type:complete
MAIQPMNANQLQVSYNDQLNDYNKNLFGDSVKFAALQNTKKSIAEVREKREASFAKSENERWNAENPLATETSSLGPMTQANNNSKEPNRVGVMQNNLISNNFNNSSQVAANGVFGSDQIENSFDRSLPLTQQQLPVDDVGMNSLYNNNKTV